MDPSKPCVWTGLEIYEPKLRTLGSRKILPFLSLLPTTPPSFLDSVRLEERSLGFMLGLIAV